MTMWLLSLLGGSAGLFYGLWQRSRASRFQHDAKLANEALARGTAWAADALKRAEAVTSDLKTRLERAEGAALANASPDELRRRLNQLFGT